MLAQNTRFVHYDPTRPITLAADASSYGIGAVISQYAPDGTEEPIAFASKTLTSTEKNYSQVEKEALSIIFGVRKFHLYLSGRHFQLTTDHKPLLGIFSPEKSLPVMTLQQLQRWPLIMMGYDYHTVYRKFADHANADALSRLPIGSDPNVDKEENIVEIDSEVNMLDSHVILNLPLSAKTVADYTRKDPILARCYTSLRMGGRPRGRIIRIRTKFVLIWTPRRRSHRRMVYFYETRESSFWLHFVLESSTCCT